MTMVWPRSLFSCRSICSTVSEFFESKLPVSRGLVREENLRLIDDRPRDGYALLLAAGEFRGFVVQTPCQTEHLRHNIEAVRVESVAMNKLRDGDIPFGRQSREQIESLKDEADLVAAQFGTRCVAQFGEVIPVDQHFAARGLGQAANHVQQRRLAAAGRPHDGDRFPGLHFEIHAT